MNATKTVWIQLADKLAGALASRLTCGSKPGCQCDACKLLAEFDEAWDESETEKWKR